MNKLIEKWRQGVLILSLTAGLLALSAVDQTGWHADSAVRDWPVSTQAALNRSQSKPAAKAADAKIPVAASGKLIFGEISSSNISPMAQRLFSAMSHDEFSAGKPFAGLSTYRPMEELAAMDITGFDRETLRTSAYQGAVGYDLVRYTIHMKKGMDATVMAFKKQTGKGEIALGQFDDRPVFVLVSLPGDHSSKVYRYEMGDLTTDVSLPLKEASTLIDTQMQSSTKVMFASVGN